MLRKLLIFTIFFANWHQVFGASPATSEANGPPMPAPKQNLEISKDSALKLYKNKNFAQSIEVLSKLMEKTGPSSDLHYNLFINYYGLNDMGNALGNLRASLELTPNYAESISALNALPKKWKSRFFLKRGLISKLSIQLHYFSYLSPLLWIFILCSFICIRVTINIFALSREEEELPASLYTMAVISALSFILISTLCVIKLDMVNQTRATLLLDSAARVTPNLNSPEILNLNAGEQIVVNSVKDKWVQVKDLSGKQAWLPKDSLFFSTKEL